MTAKRISRRTFFKIAGLAVGGGAAACCGLGYAVSQGMPKTEIVQAKTPEFSFGKENPKMEKPILVAYATRTGSTVGVAAAIGETIAARGYAVDVKPVNESLDPGAYQSVVIGSAVNGGKWLPEAVAFVQRSQQTLQQKPVALFCVHILNLGDDAFSRKNRLAYLDDVRALVTPAEEGFFAGKGMSPDDTSPILRWLVQVTNFVPEGDCRDWTKINAWAQNLFV